MVSLRNVFRLIASAVNTDASTWFLPSDLFRTYSQPQDRVANFSQNKRVFSCNPMHDLRESRYKTSQAQFLPSTISLASLHETHVRARHWAIFNGTPPSQLRTNRIGIKCHDRGWSARRQQLSVAMYIYTYKFSP